MEKEDGYFTNELLQNLEKKKQKEMKKNGDHLPPEEKREKAKKSFPKNVCLQFAGATTGALIGALLGVVVALSVVIALLIPFCSACKNIKAGRGAAAGGAGADAVKAVTAGVVGVAALVGVIAGALVSGGAGSSLALGVVGVVGGVTGWKAAEEADSVYEAMTKAAKLNCENATVVVEKIRELVALAFNDKLEEKIKNN